MLSILRRLLAISLFWGFPLKQSLCLCYKLLLEGKEMLLSVVFFLVQQWFLWLFHVWLPKAAHQSSHCVFLQQQMHSSLNKTKHCHLELLNEFHRHMKHSYWNIYIVLLNDISVHACIRLWVCARDNSLPPVSCSVYKVLGVVWWYFIVNINEPWESFAGALIKAAQRSFLFCMNATWTNIGSFVRSSGASYQNDWLWSER